jgi:hypothetical protein
LLRQAQQPCVPKRPHTETLPFDRLRGRRLSKEPPRRDTSSCRLLRQAQRPRLSKLARTLFAQLPSIIYASYRYRFGRWRRVSDTIPEGTPIATIFVRHPSIRGS